MSEKRIPRQRLLSALLISLTLASTSCDNKQGQTAKTPEPITLKVGTVTRGDGITNWDYPAVLKSNKVVEIRPRVSGYITAIEVEEGTMVQKGEVLFRIEDDTYRQSVAQAEAALASAKSQWDNALLEVKKTQPLVDEGIVSPYQLETNKSTARAGEATYNQMKASLEEAKINLAYTVITSPVSGVISNIPYDEGALVSGSIQTPLATVSASGDVQAYFSLNEAEGITLQRRIIKAQTKNAGSTTVNCRLILSDGSLYEHEGKIGLASRIVNKSTGSILIKGQFPNPDNLLSTGASAILRIPSEVKDVFIIPRESTFEMQDKKMVYLCDENNTARQKQLAVIGSNEKYLFVREGLSESDKMILEGINRIKEGQAITPSIVND